MMASSSFKMVQNKIKASSLIPLPSLFGFWIFETPARDRFLDVGKKRVVIRDGRCGELIKGKQGRDINVFL